MKYTLLQLTQAVLSSMDSDEIDSIADTVESQQVTKVIRSVYYDILARANLPEHYSLVSLTTGSSTSQPIIMTLPSTVDNLLWLKYDKHTTTDTDVQYQIVNFLSLEDFMNLMNNLNESDTNVDSFSYTSDTFTHTLIYRTDKAPDYFTTFDDNTIIFDSYDNTVDTVQLQGSKTLGYGKLSITWTESDTFTPDLDEPQFALLLNEAKALAWAELKQASHAKAEVNAKRGWTSLQKSKNAIETPTFFSRLPNYGRK